MRVHAVVVALTIATMLLSLCVVAEEEASPPSEGFDPDIATRTWYFSKATFCPVEDIAAWNCTVCTSAVSGVESVIVLHNTTTRAQGLVAYDSVRNWVVVAFRGSYNNLNWIEDFDFLYVNYTNPACRGPTGSLDDTCKVHAGFNYVFESLRPQLDAAFNVVWQRYSASSSPSIMVTGHSLGAAVSMLAYAHLVASFASVISADKFQLYNFGEPRVGNPAFAFWVTNSVLPTHKQYRVTHKADPVPRLPPMDFGYLHAPHEVWYNNDLAGFNFTFCNDNATHEDMSCVMSQPTYNMTDHGLYMGIIWGCKL